MAHGSRIILQTSYIIKIHRDEMIPELGHLFTNGRILIYTKPPAPVNQAVLPVAVNRIVVTARKVGEVI